MKYWQSRNHFARDIESSWVIRIICPGAHHSQTLSADFYTRARWARSDDNLLSHVMDIRSSLFSSSHGWRISIGKFWKFERKYERAKRRLIVWLSYHEPVRLASRSTPLTPRTSIDYLCLGLCFMDMKRKEIRRMEGKLITFFSLFKFIFIVKCGENFLSGFQTKISEC